MFLFDRLNSKFKIPDPEQALPGRDEPIPTATHHFVNGELIAASPPEGHKEIFFGMGCFWGVERLFWEQDGVHVTAAGYQGGITPNPTYQEVCTGMTGHNETVRVVYNPSVLPLEKLLALFWESHDPTQGMRQGNDQGTQYRSGIYTTTQEQFDAAERTRAIYGAELEKAGKSTVTTEIMDAPPFYYAEEYHQQYLAKNPNGYCNMRGAGVACPIPAGTTKEGAA